MGGGGGTTAGGFTEKSSIGQGDEMHVLRISVRQSGMKTWMRIFDGIFFNGAAGLWHWA